MDPAKISGITQWPISKKLKDLQSFLGFCNFYCCFIEHYSKIAHPLFLLSKKDVSFTWTSDQDNAFQALIYAFTIAPVLALPNNALPYRLITDTSDYALGAILEQSDALNHWHPVAFYSKSMLPAEQNYDIYDKKLLAIIHAIKSFRHYLKEYPISFKIWTNHNNLAYFHTKQKLSCHQAWWSLFLSQFNFTIIHKLGTMNKADALSRQPDHEEEMPFEGGKLCILLDSKFFSIHATWPTSLDTQDTSL